MKYFLLSFCFFATSASLKIASFNVQVFGLKKANTPEIISILAKIVQRYDIILIQEIREPTGSALQILLDKTNQLGPNRYMNITSARLGRTNSKEQYAFLYRPGKDLKIVDSFQDSDAHDVFQREPFSVRFKSTKTVLEEFTLMAIHVDPGEAKEEIIALPVAVQDARKFFKSDNILIMGDLNAGCNYLSKKSLKAIRAASPDLEWIVSDKADTTVSKNKCAYDRFIAYKDKMLDAVRTETVKVFNYDSEYKLAQEEALDISDHYPIELELVEKKKSFFAKLFKG